MTGTIIMMNMKMNMIGNGFPIPIPLMKKLCLLIMEHLIIHLQPIDPGEVMWLEQNQWMRK